MKKTSKFLARIMVGVIILPMIISLLDCIEVRATVSTTSNIEQTSINAHANLESWTLGGNSLSYENNISGWNVDRYSITYLEEMCLTLDDINKAGTWYSMYPTNNVLAGFTKGNTSMSKGSFTEDDWDKLGLKRSDLVSALSLGGGNVPATGLSTFLGILNVVSSGSMSFNELTRIGLPVDISSSTASLLGMDVNNLGNILTEFTNVKESNDEALIPVYQNISSASCGAFENSDDIWWIGCDYNRDSGYFLYFYIACVNYSMDASNFTILVFKSDTLIGTRDFSNQPSWNSKDWSSLIDAIMVNPITGDNIITDLLNGNVSENSDTIRRVKQLDSIMNISDEDEVLVGPLHWMYPIILGGGGHTPTLIFAEYDLGNMISNLPYSRSFIQFDNPDWITFGDSSGLVESTSFRDSNDKNDGTYTKGQEMIFDISASILSSAAIVGGDNTVNTIDNMLNNIPSSMRNGFTYRLLSGQKNALVDAIAGQNINLARSEGRNLVIPRDRQGDLFFIAEQLIGLSIDEYLSNKKELSGFYVYGEGSEDYVYVSPTENYPNGVKTWRNLWNSLTAYQRSILAIEYLQKVNSEQSKIPEGKRLPCIRDYTLESYEYYSGLKDDTRINLESIRREVEEYDMSRYTPSGSVTNIAIVSSIAAKYVIASSLYNNSNEDAQGAFALYNDKLESLVSGVWTYTNDSGQKNYFAYMPKNMNLFGSNTQGYRVMLGSDKNYDRLVGLLYNVEYAFAIFAFSEFGDTNNYDTESITDYISRAFDGDVDETVSSIFSWTKGSKVRDIENPASLDFNGDEVSINMLRSIIELHDMCEFLGIGIGDWSPTIDAYLQIWINNQQFFNQLRNNPLIYAEGERGSNTVEEPLGVFFSVQNKAMTDQWSKGFAMSALYVPMETNLYDASSIAFLNDPDWIANFYYKYAFFRKALYINTDNSAIVNNKVSGESSGTRVATLNDLLNYDRDIILTIDPNFYNANEINNVISRLDYTGVRNAAGAAKTEEESLWENVEDWFSELADLSAPQILKTAGNSYYSTVLASNATKFGQERKWDSMYDAYLLSAEDILGINGHESAIDAYEYSPKQSYAVVSAVYRSAELYNEVLRSITSDNAIFKSSNSIAQVEGSSYSDWRALYNYWMLANLAEQMKNDTASTLDLDSPIFCDIFGNIITESGIVIIPAATNATLCGNNWTPYTVGFSEYYNNGNKIKYGVYPDKVYTWLCGYDVSSYSEDGLLMLGSSSEPNIENGGGFFVMGTNGELVLRTTSISSQGLTAIVQWTALNKNSTIVKQLFYNDAYFNKGLEAYNYRTVNLVVETLRGAPIENIDYDFEGLSGNVSISKYGVYMAYKLEELTNALVSGTNGNQLGGNAVVTMPNLAFVSGIEYIVLYVFKIVFALSIVGLMVSLYLDAVRSKLGLVTMGKFIVTLLMVIVAITVIPNLISWSYYKANKTLLTEEVGYMMMLNYVKEYDGSEIGITRVTTPETETELYLKVGDASIDWWNLLDDVLFTNTFSTVEEVYEESMRADALAGQECVQVKGDGLYMNVLDIFGSTNMSYSPTNGIISNVTITERPDASAETVASFSLPYYVILDQLVNNINEYNVSRGVDAYSYSVGSNGHILTYDMITPYLTSPEFLEEGYDILGLNRILNTGNNLQLYAYTFSQEDADRWSRSAWYPNDSVSLDTRIERINKIYEYARNYIAENKNVLGKVPDEVFLKVMALQISIEYNRQFHISHANSVEIMNIDTRDIMRFMIADRGQMYKYYAYSFPRYTYEKAGTIGVVFAALLIVLFWLTSFLKPLFMVIILGLLIINVIGRRFLFKQESRCIEGYLIGSACLVLCNYLYAVMLKMTLSVANFGFGSILAMILAFVIQVVYVFALIGIMTIEVKDWKNNGFNEFATVGSSIMSSVVHAQQVVADRLMSKRNESYNDTKVSRQYTNDEVGRELMDKMYERDAEREERGNYNPS